MRWHTGESNPPALASSATAGQLTDKGQLVLSAFFASWNQTTNPATFLKLFVNNFFNLVPACGACNKAKNNR